MFILLLLSMPALRPVNEMFPSSAVAVMVAVTAVTYTHTQSL